MGVDPRLYPAPCAARAGIRGRPGRSRRPTTPSRAGLCNPDTRCDRRSGHKLVSGEQRSGEGLRERYILRVVRSEVVSQPPHAIEQHASRVAEDQERPQVLQRLLHARWADLVSTLPSAQDTQHLHVDQIACSQRLDGAGEIRRDLGVCGGSMRAASRHMRRARIGTRASTAAVRGVHYVAVMAIGPVAAPRSVRVFDDVADEYDQRRPTYPNELVATACELAGIARGDRVLEVGCGSGQLTSSLLARGLHVVAVEPGARLLSLAEKNLQGSDDVDLVHVRFEDAQLPRRHFRAVFSASAFHWINPEVSWQKAADVLVPGGGLALLQYFGLSDRHSRPDQELLLAAVGRIAPEVASEWPSYRDLAATVAGVERRRENISEAWGWLGGYDLTQAHAGKLFSNVQMAALPAFLEQSADELSALARTTSFYARLSPSQRQALEGETLALSERLGRPVRSSTVAVAVTARLR